MFTRTFLLTIAAEIAIANPTPSSPISIPLPLPLNSSVRANGLKVGLEITNWNWTTEYLVNDTYVGMTFQVLTQASTEGSLFTNNDSENLYFHISLGVSRLLLTLERGLVLDGVASLVGAITAGSTLPIFAIPTMWIGGEFMQGFCSSSQFPFVKWKTIFYDPSIVSLVTTFASPTSGPTSKTPSWVIPVAVVVPIIVVVIAIALVFTLVPAAKHCIRPFSKRASTITTVKRGASVESSTRWAQASKPTIIDK